MDSPLVLLSGGNGSIASRANTTTSTLDTQLRDSDIVLITLIAIIVCLFAACQKKRCVTCIAECEERDAQQYSVAVAGEQEIQGRRRPPPPLIDSNHLHDAQWSSYEKVQSPGFEMPSPRASGSVIPNESSMGSTPPASMLLPSLLASASASTEASKATNGITNNTNNRTRRTPSVAARALARKDSRRASMAKETREALPVVDAGNHLGVNSAAGARHVESPIQSRSANPGSRNGGGLIRKGELAEASSGYTATHLTGNTRTGTTSAASITSTTTTKEDAIASATATTHDDGCDGTDINRTMNGDGSNNTGGCYIESSV